MKKYCHFVILLLSVFLVGCGRNPNSSKEAPTYTPTPSPTPEIVIPNDVVEQYHILESTSDILELAFDSFNKTGDAYSENDKWDEESYHKGVEYLELAKQEFIRIWPADVYDEFQEYYDSIRERFLLTEQYIPVLAGIPDYLKKPDISGLEKSIQSREIREYQAKYLKNKFEYASKQMAKMNSDEYRRAWYDVLHERVEGMNQ